MYILIYYFTVFILIINNDKADIMTPMMMMKAVMRCGSGPSPTRVLGSPSEKRNYLDPNSAIMRTSGTYGCHDGSECLFNCKRELSARNQLLYLFVISIVT